MCYAYLSGRSDQSAKHGVNMYVVTGCPTKPVATVSCVIYRCMSSVWLCHRPTLTVDCVGGPRSPNGRRSIWRGSRMLAAMSDSTFIERIAAAVCNALLNDDPPFQDHRREMLWTRSRGLSPHRRILRREERLGLSSLTPERSQIFPANVQPNVLLHGWN